MHCLDMLDSTAVRRMRTAPAAVYAIVGVRPEDRDVWTLTAPEKRSRSKGLGVLVPRVWARECRWGVRCWPGETTGKAGRGPIGEICRTSWPGLQRGGRCSGQLGPTGAPRPGGGN